MELDALWGLLPFLVRVEGVMGRRREWWIERGTRIRAVGGGSCLSSVFFF